MEDGYEISGDDVRLLLAGYDTPVDLEVVAGFKLFRSLKRLARKIKKSPITKALRQVVPAALPAAAAVFPPLLPTAVAATTALKLADAVSKGKKPARVAYQLMRKGAQRGDPDMLRWARLVNEALPMARARQLRQLARASRMGPRGQRVPAARLLQALGQRADFGDRSLQKAFELAAGTFTYAPREVPEAATVAGVWHQPYRSDAEAFTPRDAYYEGLQALTHQLN